ncbi:MAG: aminoacyl-tRNA hydrolase [Gammaproteobacteria bacterium]|nr:aminoacyl-tRNA hydrolase [Gammaproteobacteria bacterium]
MIEISSTIVIHESEIHISFIRSPGPGGQNINKVATGVLLRFNVFQSPHLTEAARSRLINLAGKKMTLQGELIIKATRHRTQARNKQDALDRLKDLLSQAAISPKKRRATKPTYASKVRLKSEKKLHAKVKSLRGKVREG